ncbi:MAG TPA: metalloregulator ArsR/SmtB family transcription factor [Jatrophihabitantaceae bacterium]
MSSTQLVAPRAATRLEEAGQLLRVLAAPIRLAVIEQLADGPRCVHELVESLGASQSLVSQHLRVLRAARLVTSERRGREIAYALTDNQVAHIVRDAIIHTSGR